MKKLNFKEFKIEVEIGDFQLIDVRKEIGNFLFKQAANLAIDELSRKIFKSEGEIEIEDEDFTQMLELLQGVIVFRVWKAIEDNAVEVKTEKENN